MDQYEEVTTTLASIDYKFLVDDWVIKPRFSYRKNQDDYVFLREDPTFFNNVHQTNNFLAEINAHKVNKWGVLGIGVEYNFLDLVSNNLGERERTLYSATLEQRFQMGNLDITPGISYTSYSDFDNKLFPGLDIGYRLSEKLKAYANYGFTYRVPTYTDRFYSDPANLGNENLQPEQATTYELGVKYSTSTVNANLSAFHRDGNDLIDWVRDVDTLQWSPINIGEIATSGIELTAEYLPKDHIIDRVSLGYTLLDVEQSDVDAGFSRYALEHLNHQFVASAQYGFGKFYHSLQFRYADRENLEDYGVLDTKIGYRSTMFDFYLNATNLLDQEYRETNLVVLPGRWLIGGIRYNLRY
jgi:iron complex outermembrane receptor protein